MSDPYVPLAAALAAGTLRGTHLELPPMLLAGVGYTRAAQFVALHWTPGGDEVYVDDGEIGFTGHWRAYLTWKQHPYVAYAVPREWDFGSSDSQHTHRWLIEPGAGVVYAGEAAAVTRILRAQYPPAPAEPLHLSAEEWRELERQARQRILELLPDRARTHAAIMEQRAAEDRRCRELEAWLDGRWAHLVAANPALAQLRDYLFGPEDPGLDAAADADQNRN